MGCETSKNDKSSNGVTSKKAPRAPPTFGKKAGLDPKDFILSGLKGLHPVIKKDIGGQQFIIENCSDCTILLIDHIASLTVDCCSNVTVISGPIESSVFIRECNDCKFVIACQQLRTRDCKNCRILLFSTTGPIIESSQRIGFGCYTFTYFGIAEHFSRAGLNLWNNSWYSVYDFTPKDGGDSYYMLPASTDHWGLDITANMTEETVVGLISEGILPRRLGDADAAAAVHGGATAASDFHIPRTVGAHFAPSSSQSTSSSHMVLVCVPSELQDDLRARYEACWGALSSSCQASSTDLLLRTTVRRLDQAMAETLCNSSGSSSSASSVAKFKAALKRKCAAAKGAKKGATASATTSGQQVAVALDDSVVALQILLDEAATVDVAARIAEKLQLSSSPALQGSTAAAVGRLLGLSTAAEAYYFCWGDEAAVKSRLVFEQWLEQT